LITKCVVVSINSSFCCANAHHRIKTNHSFSSESFLITASVKICHQASLCELGVSFLTVNPAFKSNTHCLAHFSRLPLSGGSIFKSVFSSLKIFLNEGGIFIQAGTEKLNPCASPSQW
jgi:hypothetical protein